MLTTVHDGGHPGKFPGCQGSSTTKSRPKSTADVSVGCTLPRSIAPRLNRGGTSDIGLIWMIYRLVESRGITALSSSSRVMAPR